MTITGLDSLSEQNAQSFQADVSCYYQNDRTMEGLEFPHVYRLSVKEIQGQIYYRMDFQPDEDHPMETRMTALTDGSTIIIMETQTGSIVSRQSFAQNQPDLKTLLSNKIVIGRINIERDIKPRLRQLSLDFTEDNQSGQFRINYPLSFFHSNDLIHPLSATITLDMASETIKSSEVVYLDEYQNRISTVMEPIYWYSDQGEPIRVGSVTKTTTKITSMEEFENPDDIPCSANWNSATTITQSDVDEGLRNGSIQAVPGFVLGDANDNETTETTLEIYDNLIFNQVSDSLFRPILR